MRQAFRWFMVGLLTVSGALGAAGVARADISDSTANNAQDGNNRATTNQGGATKSGDAVGGQVTGVVSSGRTSVDARNTSSNSDVTSGDASAANRSGSFVGLNNSGSGPTVEAGDISNSGCVGAFGCNLQDGDNRLSSTQTVNATTGDGVAGQVVGAVTAAGGSASIVAANRSDDVSVETGDADAGNNAAAFVGLDFSEDGGPAVAADITDSGCVLVNGCNVQDGSNRTSNRQSASASTGDGVAGQVIGSVSAGATSIDARNTSTNVDVTTGDAGADNGAASFTGLNASLTGPTITAVDITNGVCFEDFTCNFQDGNNRTSGSQSAASTSGDGVAGQVIGSVTSAGGSASIVAANTSNDSDVTTGDAEATNGLAAFVGENFSFPGPVVTSDITNLDCSITDAGCNAQDGNNTLTGNQNATASTGDGVAGQVLGVVSAGAASLDATNTSDDDSVTTGDAGAGNDMSAFVGLNNSEFGPTITAGTADISGAIATNVQDGNNRKTLNQSADASSGDGVAGQVSGVVTSAGGSASVVLANTSTGIDSTSGEANFDNSDSAFVGLNTSLGTTLVD
jgi:hypothetical protein